MVNLEIMSGLAANNFLSRSMRSQPVNSKIGGIRRGDVCLKICNNTDLNEIEWVTEIS